MGLKSEMPEKKKFCLKSIIFRKLNNFCMISKPKLTVSNRKYLKTSDVKPILMN